MSKHIMLSYQWDSQDLVSKMFFYLRKAQSIPVWMDKHGGMNEFLSASMAKGVENCCALVCFLTPEYQESVNCRKELLYASQLRKPIIPCLLTSGDGDTKWKPSDWLGITITDLLYLNFTDIDDDNFEIKGQELVDKIKSVLKRIQKAQHSAMDAEESHGDDNDDDDDKHDGDDDDDKQDGDDDDDKHDGDDDDDDDKHDGDDNDDDDDTKHK